MKEEESPEVQNEPPNHETDLWKGIWALNSPNKIKNLIWRACRNSLPTKGNLVCSTIITDSICDRCLSAPETLLHAAWTCPKLDIVWSDLALWNFRFQTCFPDFKSLTAWVIANKKSSELFTMTVWFIWPQRNQLRLQQHCVSTDQLAQVARDRFEEYKAALPALKPRRQQHHTPWSPPPPDLFKINYDGAVFKEAIQSGIGVVFRNTQRVW